MKLQDILDEGIFDRFKKKPSPEEPSRFPTHANVDEWMARMVEYYKQVYPDSLWRLFCPSMGEYIPKTVHAGISRDVFKKHTSTYLQLKAQNPEAAQKAKSEVVEYDIYSGGPNEDYP